MKPINTNYGSLALPNLLELCKDPKLMAVPSLPTAMMPALFLQGIRTADALVALGTEGLTRLTTAMPEQAQLIIDEAKGLVYGSAGYTEVQINLLVITRALMAGISILDIPADFTQNDRHIVNEARAMRNRDGVGRPRNNHFLLFTDADMDRALAEHKTNEAAGKALFVSGSQVSLRRDKLNATRPASKPIPAKTPKPQ